MENRNMIFIIPSKRQKQSAGMHKTTVVLKVFGNKQKTGNVFPKTIAGHRIETQILNSTLHFGGSVLFEKNRKKIGKKKVAPENTPNNRGLAAS